MSDSDSVWSDVTLPSPTAEEERAERDRHTMLQHATFRRFCPEILNFKLTYSIFDSPRSKFARESLIDSTNKGKRREVDWCHPRDYNDINIITAASSVEFRSYLAFKPEPSMTYEDITYIDGLTSGIWLNTVEWGLRMDCTSLRLKNEDQSTLFSMTHWDPSVYCRGQWSPLDLHPPDLRTW